jgi:haloacetate dehalogenase
MSADDLFPGFERRDVDVDGARIHARIAGQGPPVMLLHGFPQTHVCWHRVAPRLAEKFTLVIPDMPGYGDSKGPAPDAKHLEYSKRAVARRMREFMAKVGFDRFALVGHDRGGRVGYRLALDHPDTLTRLVILDIVPTLEIAEATDYKRALSSWYWAFLAQPAPLPERLISAEPEFLLNEMIKGWHVHNVFDPRALAEYHRNFRTYSCIQAFCEDYRAGMSTDLEFDRADRDAGHKIKCPVTVIWGQRGTHSNYVDMIAVWKRWANEVSGAPIQSGHFLPEEEPEQTTKALIEALQS